MTTTSAKKTLSKKNTAKKSIATKNATKKTTAKKTTAKSTTAKKTITTEKKAASKNTSRKEAPEKRPPLSLRTWRLLHVKAVESMVEDGLDGYGGEAADGIKQKVFAFLGAVPTGIKVITEFLFLHHARL